MGSDYFLNRQKVSITFKEMRETLGQRFQFNPQVEKEFTFDYEIGRVVLRVLSSIPKMENYNEAYIRVCMLHGMSLKLMTWFRVPKDTRWKLNLTMRVSQIIEEATQIKLCECGGLLHIKRGVFGRFLACSDCRFKRNLPATIIDTSHP